MGWIGESSDAGLILIVDDAPENVLILHNILKTEHEVVFARDGASALDIAIRQSPDLILLDAIMPGMDGFECCEALKAHPKTRDIPVIFLTGLDQPDQETRALRIGAVDFVTRPVANEVLLARVKQQLKVKRQSDGLRKLSLIDELTGIATRSRFDEDFEREWRRCLRANQPLALVLVDIDDFQAYNAKHGHQSGDVILKRVATALAGSFRRPGDLLARYGGEEFIALLPDQDAVGARRMIDMMRAAVTDVSPEITMSFGFAAAYPAAEISPQSLLKRVEDCLSKANAAGPGGTEGNSTSGAEILIIEDEPLTRRMMEQILANAGYSVRCAGDGESGFAMATTRPPALVLIDIGLPGKSGFKIAELFRDTPAHQQGKAGGDDGPEFLGRLRYRLRVGDRRLSGKAGRCQDADQGDRRAAAALNKLPKRSTPRPVMSISAGRPHTTSDTALPAPQAIVQPRVPWPVLRNRLGTCVAPITGTESGVTGRSPVHNSALSKSTAPGNSALARSTTVRLRTGDIERSQPANSAVPATRRRSPRRL